MLQCWIRRRLLSFVTLCIVAKRCKSYYWEPIGSRIWEIDWYQNELPWPLFRGRIKVTSTIALHLTLNISESVRDRGLLPNFQKFERSNSWPQYARAQSRKRLDLETPFQRTTNRKWHRPYAVSNGHVTHHVTWPWPRKVLWGSTVGFPSDSLTSCLVSASCRAP